MVWYAGDDDNGDVLVHRATADALLRTVLRLRLPPVQVPSTYHTHTYTYKYTYILTRSHTHSQIEGWSERYRELTTLSRAILCHSV
jgi:hypothetical protein